MNHHHTQYEAISYFVRYGSPADVRENVMITGRVYESVPKASDIIDGNILEDYFYNS